MVFGEEPMMVVEHLDVGRVDDYFRLNARAIEPQTRLRYCWQLASALSFIGSHGFVHRNITMDSLRLASHGVLKVGSVAFSFSN